MTLHGEVIEIDEGLEELISLMWDIGFETQFCCEGYDWDHPVDGDEHSWYAEHYRGYILMPWTTLNRDLVINLQQNFFRFHGNVPVNWSIDYEKTEYFEGMNRICLRFPKVDIPALVEFITDEYKTN